MTKWILIIAFNIVFGLFSGYVTSLVFGSKEGMFSGDSEYQKKENRTLFLIVTGAAILSGIVWSSFFTKGSGWYFYGLFFGITTTLLTPIVLYIHNQWMGLIYDPKPGIVTDTKLNFLIELYRSLKFMDVLVITFFTLLYGIFTLVTPILGLLWGYLMKRFILKME